MVNLRIIKKNRLLEFTEKGHSELLFQTIAVKSKQAFQPITVTVSRIFFGKSLELLVHASVEVVTQKVRPESEQGVHRP